MPRRFLIRFDKAYGALSTALFLPLHPAQRAYVMGIPVRLRQLMVSVADPAALASALSGS